MGEKFLSQEEIDSLLKKNVEVDALEEKEDWDLSSDEKDIMAEVGNISMSAAAATLSKLTGRKVEIKSPKVLAMRFGNLVKEIETPQISFQVQFEEGLRGNNVLLIKKKDASIISDLMMGGDGSNPTEELSEMETGTVSEAMSQMIGSISIAISTMISKTVEIESPLTQIWKNDEEILIQGIEDETGIVKISFMLIVEDLINSEIIQLYLPDTAKEIIEEMLDGTDSEKLESEQEEEAREEDCEIGHEEEHEASGEEILQKEDASAMKYSDSGVSIHKPAFSELKEQPGQRTPRNIELIMDVPLELSVVLGRAQKSIRDILSLEPGSIVELNKLAEEPLEIYVNGKHTARGEVVVVDEKFGIRITDILSAEDRVRKLV